MLGSVKLDTTPAVVIRPTELLLILVNHRAPSGPVIPPGPSMLGSVKLDTTPPTFNVFRQRSARLMDKYADAPMELADATLVALAEETGRRKIFSLDSDFPVFRIRGRQ